MGKKQKKFIFSKFFEKKIPKGYAPYGYFTPEDEFIAIMNKSGYLIKNIRRMEVLIGDCARANVPLEERKELQKQLNSNDTTTIKTQRPRN